MPSCDICGKLANMRAVVEGAEVNVCPMCSRYGKVLRAPTVQRGGFASSQSAAEVELVNGYGKLIEAGRTTAGFSREQLAKKLNMREADLLHFEEGKLKPTEAEAKKLEAVLKIRILSSDSPVSQQPLANKPISKALTLGDVIIIKDKRK